MAKPFPITTWPYVRSGYLSRGRTVGELAEKIGINPDGLAKKVAEFNEGARRGEDPEFGRGSTHSTSGPATQTTPGPTLARVARASSVLCGEGGTGQLRHLRRAGTDTASRVLDDDDQPIDGLFAVEVDQASVMGGHYPSGGISLGPAMAFSYLTGRLLASTTGTARCLPTRAGRPDGPR